MAQPVFYGSASMVEGSEVGSVYLAVSEVKSEHSASRDPADVGYMTPDVFHAMFRLGGRLEIPFGTWVGPLKGSTFSRPRTGRQADFGSLPVRRLANQIQ